MLFDSNPCFVPFGFAGGIFDPAIKLERFGVRDYEANIGRWICKDPILFKAEESDFYVYCSNNPINSIDPNGQANLALVKAISYGVLGAMTNAFSSWHRGDDVGTSAAIGFVFGFVGGSIDRSHSTNVLLATGLSILGNIVAQQFGNKTNNEMNKVDVVFKAIGSFSVAAYTECFSDDFAGAAMAATVFCGIQQMLIGEMIFNLYKN